MATIIIVRKTIISWRDKKDLSFVSHAPLLVRSTHSPAQDKPTLRSVHSRSHGTLGHRHGRILHRHVKMEDGVKMGCERVCSPARSTTFQQQCLKSRRFHGP